MGVVPLQFLSGESAASLNLTGKEKYTIKLVPPLKPGQLVDIQLSDGRSFQVKLRFDTDIELEYFKQGGILNFMVRKLLL
jgi:aconitate hydratase